MWSLSQIILSVIMTVATITITYYWTYRITRKFSVKGCVVFVTGACSPGGLGLCLAGLAKAHGAKTVIVTSRSDEAGLQALEYLECVSGAANIVHVTLDLNWSETEIESTINKLWLNVGSIDVLIANAGVSYRGEILGTSDEVHKKIMQSNHFGNVSLIKAVVNQMKMAKELKPCYIVGVTSIQGRISIPYRSAYSSSKHAFSAFLDCLRSEISKYNISVLNICPSYINTNLSKNALRDSGDKHSKLDPTTAHGMQPEEVACRIYASLRNGDNELMILDWKSTFALYFRTLLPLLYFKIMDKRAKSSTAY